MIPLPQPPQIKTVVTNKLWLKPTNIQTCNAAKFLVFYALLHAALKTWRDITRKIRNIEALPMKHFLILNSEKYYFLALFTVASSLQSEP